MNDILQRIRWPNVARAAAVLSAVALLISWPHLRARAPELPPATAAPAEVEPMGPAPDVAEADGEKKPAAKAPTAAADRAGKRPTAKAPPAHPKTKAPQARHRTRRSRRQPTARSTPTPAATPAPAQPPAYVTPAPPTPPGAEFRP
jgi:hypothetical protein